MNKKLPVCVLSAYSFYLTSFLSLTDKYFSSCYHSIKAMENKKPLAEVKGKFINNLSMYVYLIMTHFFLNLILLKHLLI